jgi:hypothetical protein
MPRFGTGIKTILVPVLVAVAVVAALLLIRAVSASGPAPAHKPAVTIKATITTSKATTQNAPTTQATPAAMALVATRRVVSSAGRYARGAEMTRRDIYLGDRAVPSVQVVADSLLRGVGTVRFGVRTSGGVLYTCAAFNATPVVKISSC